MSGASAGTNESELSTEQQECSAEQRLPWHDQQWQVVAGAAEQNRLHHATLLLGPRGTGKRRFAGAFMAALLCTTNGRSELACGQCRACRLRTAGNHPDLHWLVPEPDKRSIGISQVRETIDAVSLTSQSASPKVVVVSPAEALTRNAANTLLKTLEEPPGACQFVLIAARGGLLLPTIRSRCQVIAFSVPATALALRWLAEAESVQDLSLPSGCVEAALRAAGGAPLRALEILRAGELGRSKDVLLDLLALVRGQADPARLGRQWYEWGFSGVVDQLEHAVHLLLCDRLAPEHGTAGLLTDQTPPAEGEILDLPRLVALQAACVELRAASAAGGSFNEELALVTLAIQCACLGDRLPR